jgi:hypothetical protein
MQSFTTSAHEYVTRDIKLQYFLQLNTLIVNLNRTSHFSLEKLLSLPKIQTSIPLGLNAFYLTTPVKQILQLPPIHNPIN